MTSSPPPPMASGTVELWSFREDTIVELPEPSSDGSAAEHGVPSIVTRWGEFPLPTAGSALLRALDRLTLGPVSLDNVTSGEDAGNLRGRLLLLLNDLQHCVVRSLATADGRPLVSVVPVTRTARFRPRPVSADVPHRLSRFALMRQVDEMLRIESPVAEHRVDLHRPEASRLMSAFASAVTPHAAAKRLGLPPGLVSDAVRYLTSARILVRYEEGGAFAGAGFDEDRDPALASWAPLDLMLHSHSHLGRHDGPAGRRAFHGPGQGHHGEPVIKRPPDTQGVVLPRPRLERLLEADPPVTAALEARRSIRHYGDGPLTVGLLGELLYRSARVRALTRGNVHAGDADASRVLSSRPYPSLGAAHPLELYLTAGRCAGLDRGSYHYDPLAHVLHPVPADPGDVDELLAQAGAATGLEGEPPVLLTIAARFRRATEWYEGIAYTGLLKDVGALQQTLYLVCTVMGMAPCALGLTDADLSCRTLGLDWRVEAGVGAFVLGPMPPGPPPLSGGDAVSDLDERDQWHSLCRALVDDLVLRTRG